jgi:hypothetical protein
MITINQCYDQITSNSFVKNIIENNALVTKIKSFSENHFIYYGSTILLTTATLCYFDMPFSTAFPIGMTLVITEIFLSTLDSAKAAITKTANYIKTTTQNGWHSLMRVAEAVSHIFRRVYASFQSFVSSSIHLIKAMLFSFNAGKSQTGCFSLKSVNPIEKEPSIVEKKTVSPRKKIPPSCDSLFLIKEEDTKGGLLLRCVPGRLFLENTPEEERRSLKDVLGGPLKGDPIILSFTDNTPGLFFLENDLERLPLENTSKRLFPKAISKSLKDIPENLFLEGIPVNFRSKL